MFCSLYLVHKREDMVPAGLNIAETMETWYVKNCSMTQEPRMFCEESLGKVNAKDLECVSGIGWSTNSIAWKCWLLWNKWSRKRRILMSKTSINGADGVANWSGVVNFHWTFHFQQWPKWHAMFITFLLFGNDVISLVLESRPLISVYLYTCTQPIQKQIVKYHI